MGSCCLHGLLELFVACGHLFLVALVLFRAAICFLFAQGLSLGVKRLGILAMGACFRYVLFQFLVTLSHLLLKPRMLFSTALCFLLAESFSLS